MLNEPSASIAALLISEARIFMTFLPQLKYSGYRPVTHAVQRAAVCDRDAGAVPSILSIHSNDKPMESTMKRFVTLTCIRGLVASAAFVIGGGSALGAGLQVNFT